MSEYADFADLFRRLTRAQRRTFEAVAINMDTGHNKKVLASLLERGFIGRTEETLPGWPPVTVSRYYVPLNLHRLWCEYCSRRMEAR